MEALLWWVPLASSALVAASVVATSDTPGPYGSCVNVLPGASPAAAVEGADSVLLEDIGNCFAGGQRQGQPWPSGQSPGPPRESSESHVALQPSGEAGSDVDDFEEADALRVEFLQTSLGIRATSLRASRLDAQASPAVDDGTEYAETLVSSGDSAAAQPRRGGVSAPLPPQQAAVGEAPPGIGANSMRRHQAAPDGRLAESQRTLSGSSPEAAPASKDAPGLLQRRQRLGTSSGSGTPAGAVAGTNSSSIGSNANVSATARDALRTGIFGRRCLLSLVPLPLQVKLDILRVLGYFPERDPCGPEEIVQASLGVLPARAASMLQLVYSEFHPPRSRQGIERCILVGYLLLYLISVFAFRRWNTSSPLQSEDKFQLPTCKLQHERQRFPDEAPEDGVEEASTYCQAPPSGKQSSWASCLRQRFYGGPPKSPPAGGAAFKTIEAASTFERLWQEELETRGSRGASLSRVVLKFWTMHSLATLIFVALLERTAIQIYSVFLVEHSLNYFYWLQGFVAEHGHAPDLAVPLLVAVVAFSASPLASCALASTGASIAGRLDRQLCGGVSAALLRKARRLPAGGCGSFSAHSRHDDEDVAEQADLVQLISNDVHQHLLGIATHVCACFNGVISILIMLALLWHRLRMAILAALLCAAVVAVLLAAAGAGLGRAVFAVKQATDERVALVRETLMRLQTVKCYAWEEAMVKKIDTVRRAEVAFLADFHRNLGVITGIVLMSPRLLIFAGLWGYSVMFGQHDISTVFTCMQIMAALKGSCEAFARSLARAALLGPSIRRIQRFLVTPEPPMPRLGQQEQGERGAKEMGDERRCSLQAQVPCWTELWPAADAPADGPASEPAAEPSPTMLRIHGSFAWAPGGPVVLRHVQLDIPRGSLVAVIGEVGAGKSALLRAALGDLHPMSAEEVHRAGGQSPVPVCLSRPRKVGYCPQLPQAVIGSVRQNILLGQPLHDSRYAEALSASSLDDELQQLHGGDAAQACGPSAKLTRSQQARLALARAAYCRDAELLLVDDACGDLDRPDTSGPSCPLKRFLLSPSVRDRTRLVVLRPGSPCLRSADRVLLLANGQVIEQGPPEEVLDSEGYKVLLGRRKPDAWAAEEELAEEAGPRSHRVAAPPALIELAALKRPSAAFVGQGPAAADPAQAASSQAHAVWDAALQYCSLGRWRNIVACVVCSLVQLFALLLCDVALAGWAQHTATSAQAAAAPAALSAAAGDAQRLALATAAASVQGVQSRDRHFLLGYLTWLSVGCSFCMLACFFGQRFTQRVSREVHGAAVNGLLRVPLGRVFGRRSAEEVSSQLAADVAVVDFFLFMRSSCAIAFMCSAAIPLLYIHVIMPWCITLLAVPLYATLVRLCAGCWSGSLPLRDAAASTDSEVASAAANATRSSCIVRSYGVEELADAAECEALDRHLEATLDGESTLRARTADRCMFLWSFFTTATYIVGLTNSSLVSAGMLGICLTSLLLLQSSIHLSLEWAGGAWAELGALARVQAWRQLPQEPSAALDSDLHFDGAMLRIPRSALGTLTYSVAADGFVEVCREGLPLLRSAPGNKALVAAPGPEPADLCPHCPQLGARLGAGRRLVAANGTAMDAAQLAAELVLGREDELVLEVRSDLLADGIDVYVDRVTAGSCASSPDALRNVSISLSPGCKAALRGAPGSGKSTLFMVLLRALEPRAGRVLLGGADARRLSLKTLRNLVGLVPQEPVLFSGTLRYNLDPYGMYTDERIWYALRCACLAGLVDSWPSRLDRILCPDEAGGCAALGGPGLSFGQQYLLGVARMVLRQPALLLMDESVGAAALDPHTEEFLHATIRLAFPCSTIFAVSNRPADFDCVVRLDQLDVGPALRSRPGHL